jgi:hypothetical protein
MSQKLILTFKNPGNSGIYLPQSSINPNENNHQP